VSACEICWTRASQDALLLGGSTAEHYRRRIVEQDQQPDHEPVSAEEQDA